MIKLRFATVDGIRKTKRFKTLAGARKAAHDWVGKDADVGPHYAVSADGVVTVRAEGASLDDLFGDKPADPPKGEYFKIKLDDGNYVAVTFETLTDAEMYVYEHDNFTYTDDNGVVRVIAVEIERWCTGEDGKPKRLPMEGATRDAAPRYDEIPF